MKLEQKKSELMNEKKRKMVLLAVSGLLFAIDLIQGATIGALLHYAHSKHEVHFLPPKMSEEFTLSSTVCSEGYQRDMTYFLVQLRFNVTPSSAPHQFKSLLGYVGPSLHDELRLK